MNDERKKALQKIKTARGQLDGIIRMMEEGRYCIDISNQISASTALLKKASCVLTAIEERDAEEKVSEIEAVIAALLK